jgi:hypothetical protein
VADRRNLRVDFDTQDAGLRDQVLLRIGHRRDGIELAPFFDGYDLDGVLDGASEHDHLHRLGGVSEAEVVG